MTRREILLECYSAIGIALISLLVVGSLAWAQNPIQTSYGVMCDTPEQVAQNIRGEALSKINAKNPNACANVHIAFIKMDKGEHIVNAQGTWVVTKILVLGLVEGGEIFDMQPSVQFAAFYVEERGA